MRFGVNTRNGPPQTNHLWLHPKDIAAGKRSVIVEKLIVIVFDEQSKARAGLEALRELDRDGEISLFEVALAVKAPNGRVRVIENPDDVNFPAVGVGSLTGSVLGALGGPVGILAGAAAGALIGFIINLERAGVTDDFVNDVSTAMGPGKAPVIVDVWEDWMTPLETSDGSNRRCHLPAESWAGQRCAS